jgi:hypothetical protein
VSSREGRDLFTAVQRLDLAGIIAKRLADPYAPDTVWRKVRKGSYTQMPAVGNCSTQRASGVDSVIPSHRVFRGGWTPGLQG